MTYIILLSVSALVILSYVFNWISNRYKLPSVILLLFLGMGINAAGSYLGFQPPDMSLALQILGELGLILIVLEGALDLKLSAESRPVIRDSFISASFILVATSAVIAGLLIYFLDLGMRSAAAYAIPLAVVSSAIAIPSIGHLSEQKKSFVIYESTFSDIIGILLFGYITSITVTASNITGKFGVDILLIILVSLVSSLLLLFFMHYIKTRLKLIFLLTFMVGVYAFTKIFHLPSLLTILVFGLVLNNLDKATHPFFKLFDLEKIDSIAQELKIFSTELAFLIRTFFFILFGYTFQYYSFATKEIIWLGIVIFTVILITRYILLRFILDTHIYPELFIAPRGLVTIILFYNIPEAFRTEVFSDGIVYFVVIASSLAMMAGLMLSKEEYHEEPKTFMGN